MRNKVVRLGFALFVAMHAPDTTVGSDSDGEILCT